MAAIDDELRKLPVPNRPFVEETLPVQAGTVPTRSAPAILGPESTTWRFGDYEILDEIARGGMGVVYKARQVKAGRLVALKMILSGHLAGDEEVQRFYGEAQSAAQLDHPNIVPVFDVGEHDGQHYFSMGFVQGRTLKHMANERPLPPERAARFVQIISEAIAYAHSRGVVHRDLKSANVLVDQDDNPRVTDFGLAKVLDSSSQLTVSGQIVGTPSYMPPEQAAGRIAEVGPLSDVYSLGAILYELVTGRPPFQAASVLDVLNAVLTQDPIRPRTLSATINQDLETICLKCLEKSPQRRYQSAAELADELGRFLRHEPIRARRVGAFERGWRWCKRHRTLSTLAAGLLASLVMGIVSTSYFALQMRFRAIEADRSASRERDARHQAQREQFAALVNKARLEIATASEPGWTWSSLQDLESAARLDVPKDGTELRSLVLRTLQSADAKPIGEIETDGEVSDLCFADQDKQLFLAVAKKGWEYRVYVHDVKTLQRRETLSAGSGLDNLDRLVQLQKSFQDGITTLAVSMDGRCVAAGTRHGKMIVWDRHHPGQAETIQAYGADDEVYHLEFAADGRGIYSSSKGREGILPGIRRYTFHDSNRNLRLTHEYHEVGCDFSVDRTASRIAVMHDHLQIIDTASNQPSHFRETFAGKLQFSRDGRFLCGERDGSVLLVDMSTGARVAAASDPDFPSPLNGDQVQFVGDSFLVAASSASGEGVRIFDLMRGQRLLTLKTAGRTKVPFALSNDGQLLAVAESHRIALYQLRLPLDFQLPPDPNSWYEQVDFSADGRQLQVMRTVTRNQLLPINVDIVDFVDRERTSFHGGRAQTRVVVSSALVETPLVGETESPLCFSADFSQFWAVNDSDQLGCWTIPDCQRKYVFSNRAQSLLSGKSRIKCIDTVGDFVAVGTAAGQVLVLDAATGKLREQVARLEDEVTAIALFPTGEQVIAGTMQGCVLVFDKAGTQPAAWQHDRTPICSLGLSPHTRELLVGSAGGILQVYAESSGSWVSHLTIDTRGDRLRFAAISPTGKHVVYACEQQITPAVLNLGDFRERLRELGAE